LITSVIMYRVLHTSPLYFTCHSCKLLQLAQDMPILAMQWRTRPTAVGIFRLGTPVD